MVTSEFHAGRTRAAFEWVWGLWSPGLNGADDDEGRQHRGGTSCTSTFAPRRTTG